MVSTEEEKGSRAEQELLDAKIALRESNERIVNISESITDGFVVLDREWRFEYVNERALEFFRRLDRTREYLIGKGVWDEFPDVEGWWNYMAARSRRAAQASARAANSSFHCRIN